MQTITAKEVCASARDFYDRKLLTAQGPNPRCQYIQPSGHRCALGSVFTDETLAALKAAGEELEAQARKREQEGATYYPPTLYNDRVAGSLVSGEIIKFATTKDFEMACTLQQCHDNWCNAIQKNAPPHILESFQSEFVGVLDNITKRIAGA